MVSPFSQGDYKQKGLEGWGAPSPKTITRLKKATTISTLPKTQLDDKKGLEGRRWGVKCENSQ